MKNEKERNTLRRYVLLAYFIVSIYLKDRLRRELQGNIKLGNKEKEMIDHKSLIISYQS